MWIHDRERALLWKGQSYRRAQVKYDGHRLTLFKDATGLAYAFGRKTDQELEMSHRFAAIRESTWFKRFVVSAPPRTSVDGELWIPDTAASSVPTALRNPDKFDLRFTSFAVPFWRGTDRRLSVDFDDCLDMAADMGIVSALWFDKCNPNEWVPGSEGWVLKQRVYDGWWKVKAECTLDAIVTGIKEGDGKYIGLIGALRCSVYQDGELHEIAAVSGMTDAERIDMTDAWDSGALKGRVIEIKYQLTAARGRLRHPRFSRFRDDKPASECDGKELT